MTESDAMELMRYLRAKGYTAAAEWYVVDGRLQWQVVATKKRRVA